MPRGSGGRRKADDQHGSQNEEEEEAAAAAWVNFPKSMRLVAELQGLLACSGCKDEKRRARGEAGGEAEPGEEGEHDSEDADLPPGRVLLHPCGHSLCPRCCARSGNQKLGGYQHDGEQDFPKWLGGTCPVEKCQTVVRSKQTGPDRLREEVGRAAEAVKRSLLYPDEEDEDQRQQAAQSTKEAPEEKGPVNSSGNNADLEGDGSFGIGRGRRGAAKDAAAKLMVLNGVNVSAQTNKKAVREPKTRGQRIGGRGGGGRAASKRARGNSNNTGKGGKIRRKEPALEDTDSEAELAKAIELSKAVVAVDQDEAEADLAKAIELSKTAAEAKSEASGDENDLALAIKLSKREAKLAGQLETTEESSSESSQSKEKTDEVPQKTNKTTTSNSNPPPKKATKNNNKQAALKNGKGAIAPAKFPKLNLDRRNAKGETQLQRASIKNDIELVRDLLRRGASANVRDNAGWTPLHEAAQRGFAAVVELLLTAGRAKPSPTSEEDRLTPLHEAAIGGHAEVVRLLIENGADREAKDAGGRAPAEVAVGAALEALQMTECKLTDSQRLLASDDSICSSGEGGMSKKVLYLAGVEDDEVPARTLAENLAQAPWTMGLVTIEARLKHDVTHVIYSKVSDDRTVNGLPGDRLMEYYQAVAEGKAIVNSSWLSDCLSQETMLPEDNYLVAGLGGRPSGAPAATIRAARAGQPKLFRGTRLYLQGRFQPGTGCPCGKPELGRLLRAAEANLLVREPDPERIPPDEKKAPFHAKDPLMKSCSNIIVYQEGMSKVPIIRYNMEHIKSVRSDWIFDCLDRFEIVNPNTYEDM